MNTDDSITKIVTAINNHRQHEALAPFELCVQKDCREAIGLLRTMHQESFAWRETQTQLRWQQGAVIIIVAVAVMVWWFSR